ncbi:PAS domain-containing protein [Methylobacterium sp. CM6257]
MNLVTTASAALQAAGFVGTWDTDVPAGRSVLDAGAASLLAGNPRLAGTPLALDDALGGVHPEDRDWVFGKIRRIRQTGGRVSMEFRIVTGTGETRWILNRGCLMPDALGRLRGRGVYIDITDLHTRPAALPNGAAAQADPLDAAADYCIAAHGALERHGDTHLRMVSGMLLLGVGRALARRAP